MFYQLLCPGQTRTTEQELHESSQWLKSLFIPHCYYIFLDQDWVPWGFSADYQISWVELGVEATRDQELFQMPLRFFLKKWQKIH